MEPKPNAEKIRCRLIADADLGAVAALLHEGFPGRGLTGWQRGLARLALRDVPGNAPRYGYCVDAGGTIVGVILLIAGERRVDGFPQPFTNVASWYVKPDYRAYAQLLVSMALKHRATTYTNVTAAPHTWPIVEKQGYAKYCGGLFFAAAALKRPAAGITIRNFEAVAGRPDVLAMPDYESLQRHAIWGCRALVAEEQGQLTGLIFRRYTLRSGRLKLPAMYVLHAPDRDELVRMSGNIGRHFLPVAAPILVMDADGPVEGLAGFYTSARGRKYVRGPHTPAFCDLADTELAIFGL